MKINVNVKVKTLRAYKLVADRARSSKEELPHVKDSRDIYELLTSSIYDPDEADVTESFYAIFLDSSNGVKGYIKVSSGGVANVLADPRIIFCSALKCLATGIIVSHNHPSGVPRPSNNDRVLTQKLSAGAKLLDIRLVDHIIVGSNRYYSFLDNGELTF